MSVQLQTGAQYVNKKTKLAWPVLIELSIKSSPPPHFEKGGGGGYIGFGLSVVLSVHLFVRPKSYIAPPPPHFEKGGGGAI